MANWWFNIAFNVTVPVKCQETMELFSFTLQLVLEQSLHTSSPSICTVLYHNTHSSLHQSFLKNVMKDISLTCGTICSLPWLVKEQIFSTSHNKSWHKGLYSQQNKNYFSRAVTAIYKHNVGLHSPTMINKQVTISTLCPAIGHVLTNTIYSENHIYFLICLRKFIYTGPVF